MKVKNHYTRDQETFYKANPYDKRTCHNIDLFNGIY